MLAAAGLALGDDQVAQRPERSTAKWAALR